MNQTEETKVKTASEENVLFGVIGAFLFSLAGGVLYVLLSRIGFIAALSGLVAAVCAIKGYAFFGKSESKRGVIISVIIAALVIIFAWYLSFCLDMVEAYKGWVETGEADYAPTVFEYIPYGVLDLTVNPLYFVDLVLSLLLGAYGCWSYVKNKLKTQKVQAEATEQTPEAFEAEQTTEASEAEQTEPQQTEPAAPAEEAKEAFNDETPKE